MSDSDNNNLSSDPGGNTERPLSRKEQIEIEKLEAERDKARAELSRLTSGRWKVAAFCSGITPVVAGIAGVTIAACGLFIPWKLGTYTVAEERIKLHIANLQTQKHALDGEVQMFEVRRTALSNELQALTQDREMAKEFVGALDQNRGHMYTELSQMATTNQSIFGFLRRYGYGRPTAPARVKVE